ncbi:hypothetical protein HDV01_000629 [Terramyces sp. JEL0728]|nr:hypothetical protein HDV01_000629 [Terramyces sp. JEL0728]
MSENALRHKRTATLDTDGKAVVSRYAQGIYKPKSNSNKRQVLGDNTNNIEPPTKRSKTTYPPAIQTKVVNHVAAAKQAIKDKQQMKERRTRKAGVSANYSHVKSKVNSNINANRSSDSIMSLNGDSTIINDAMDIDVSNTYSRISLASNTSVMSTSTLVPSKIPTPDVSKSTALQRVTRTSKLSGNNRSKSITINLSPIKQNLQKSFSFPSAYNENSRFLRPAIAVKPKREYHDPLKVEEYADEIYKYWRELEVKLANADTNLAR